LSWWLRRAGHAARIVTLYGHDGPRPSLADDDLVLEGNQAGGLERVIDPVLLWRLVREIRRFRPDVVQCNGGRTVKYGALARHAAPKAVWVYRNIDSPRFWLKSKRARLIMPLVMKSGFDAAVGVSETTLREVHAAYGFQDTSRAIANGVDFLRLDTHTTPVADRPVGMAGGISVVWVGALGPQKRPDVAVEVLRRLPPDTTLTMVGEGPWRQRLDAAVESARLGDRVWLAGNREDVGPLLRSADLLLMTSDTEGIPAVAVEAQHCGLPVVAFDVGGLRECVPHEGPGALVRHGDLDALASAVVAVGRQARSDESRAQCVAWADAFSIERIGPKYLEFFEEQRRRRGLDVSDG
jgi:glycosyltransferase involved in cell wall biosynthesis